MTYVDPLLGIRAAVTTGMIRTWVLAESLKKVLVGISLVLGSYLAAGLMNASPIVQPKLRAPHTARTVILAPESPAATEAPSRPRIAPASALMAL